MQWSARPAPCSSTGRRESGRPAGSSDFPCPAHAFDQRSAHEELPVEAGVGDRAAQLVEIVLTYFRIALLEPLLVRDGLLLHELDVDRPPAALVAVEKILARLPAREKVQGFGELHRVVDAAVQAE